MLLARNGAAEPVSGYARVDGSTVTYNARAVTAAVTDALPYASRTSTTADGNATAERSGHSARPVGKVEGLVQGFLGGSSSLPGRTEVAANGALLPCPPVNDLAAR